MKSDEQTIAEPKLSQESLRDRFWAMVINIWSRRTSVIVSFSAAAILLYLILRFGLHAHRAEIPLLATLVRWRSVSAKTPHLSCNYFVPLARL